MECVGLVANQDRDDGCRSTHDGQTEVGESARQPPVVRVETCAERIVFTRAEDIDDGRDRFEIAGDDRPAEDIGAGADLEEPLKGFGTADETAGAGECLG